MAERKKSYRRGMTLIHRETKQRIIFGKWMPDGRAACITADKMFLNLDRQELEQDYISESQLDSEAREKRRGQWW